MFLSTVKLLLVSEKKLKNIVIIGKATINAIKQELKNQILYFVIVFILTGNPNLS